MLFKQIDFNLSTGIIDLSTLVDQMRIIIINTICIITKQ